MVIFSGLLTDMKGVDAATGYLVDMRMYKYPDFRCVQVCTGVYMRIYKYPDFRCLKPKPGLPSSQWPHYDMEQHRAARTQEELERVKEIPFDKEYIPRTHPGLYT